MSVATYLMDIMQSSKHGRKLGAFLLTVKQLVKRDTQKERTTLVGFLVNSETRHTGVSSFSLNTPSRKRSHLAHIREGTNTLITPPTRSQRQTRHSHKLSIHMNS